MLQLEVPIIAHTLLMPELHQIVVGAPALGKGAQPGQFVVVRTAYPGSFDPLLRVALPLAAIDRTAGTLTLLVPEDEEQRPLTLRAVGDRLDILGPLGHGWTIAPQARNLLLIGTVTGVASLLVLAEAALARGLAVTMLLGAPIGPGLPPHLVPAAVEYHLGSGPDPALAALALLDEPLLRWADTIYTTLPLPAWSPLADRIERTRMRWDRGLAYAFALPPMPCAVGVCGACAISIGRKERLACTDGPVFDLRVATRG